MNSNPFNWSDQDLIDLPGETQEDILDYKAKLSILEKLLSELDRYRKNDIKHDQLEKNINNLANELGVDIPSSLGVEHE